MCVTWHILCFFLQCFFMKLDYCSWPPAARDHTYTCPLVPTVHLNGMKRFIICCTYIRIYEYVCAYANVFGQRKRYMNNYNDNNLEKKYWKKQSTILKELKKKKRHHMTKRLIIIKEHRWINMIVWNLPLYSMFSFLFFFFFFIKLPFFV